MDESEKDSEFSVANNNMLWSCNIQTKNSSYIVLYNCTKCFTAYLAKKKKKILYSKLASKSNFPDAKKKIIKRISSDSIFLGNLS